MHRGRPIMLHVHIYRVIPAVSKEKIVYNISHCNILLHIGSNNRLHVIVPSTGINYDSLHNTNIGYYSKQHRV